MRDYLHDPDDYAHLAADYPPCGDCRHFLPTGMRGWAAGGRILRRDEGRCTESGRIVAKGDRLMCEMYERRP